MNLRVSNDKLYFYHMLCLIIQISLSSQPLIMWVLNKTSAQPLTFLLMGIPGLTYNGYGDMTECFVEEHQLESRGKN